MIGAISFNRMMESSMGTHTSDSFYLEANGALTRISCCSTPQESRVEITRCEYRNQEGFAGQKSVSKVLKNSWTLSCAKLIFCNFEGRNCLCILLRKKNLEDALSSPNMCLLVVDQLSVVKSLTFSHPSCDEIETFLLNGPSLLIFDGISRCLTYIRCLFPAGSLCQHSCPKVFSRNLQDCVKCLSVDEQTPMKKGVNILILVQEEASATRIQRVILLFEELLCSSCNSLVPEELKFQMLSTNIIPSCYLNSIKSVHRLNFTQSSLYLITIIGQLLHCVHGNIKNIFDLGQKNLHSIAHCDHSKPILAVHASDGTVCLIELVSFEVIKVLSGIFHVEIGDFLSCGSSQLLCLQSDFCLNCRDGFALLRDGFTESPLHGEKSIERSATYREFIDLPMNTEKIQQGDTSAVKKKLVLAVRSNLLQEKISLIEISDAIAHKHDVLQMSLSSLRHLMPCNHLDTEYLETNTCNQPLVDMFSYEAKEQKVRQPITNTVVQVQSTFRRILGNNMFYGLLLKNIAFHVMKEFSLHLLASVMRCTIIEPVAWNYVSSRKNLNTPLSHSSQIAPGEIGWIVGYGTIPPEMYFTNTKENFFPKNGFVSLRMNGEVLYYPLQKLMLDSEFTYSKNFRTSNISLSVDDCDMIALASMQIFKAKYQVASESHSNKLVMEIIEKKLGFSQLSDSPIFLCKLAGPLQFMQMTLTVSSECDLSLFVYSETCEQMDCFRTLLKDSLPSYFSFKQRYLTFS